MLAVFFYKLGAYLSGLLPQRLSEIITAALARSRYWINPRSRRNVQDNLRVVLGPGVADEAIRERSKRVFSNFARSIYCFLRLPHLDAAELRARCDLNGIDEVAARLLRDGGFILAGPHVGPWEIAGRCFSDLGIPIHTVTLDHPSESVTAFFDDRRRSMGITCYPISGSFRPLKNALNSKKCVALLIDRNYGRTRRKDPLFGLDVPLPSGHSVLAVRCGVPVVTAVVVFDGDCRFKFVYNGPHYPDAALDERSAVEKLQEQCRSDMEEYIRRYPEQWFNFNSVRKAAR